MPAIQSARNSMTIGVGGAKSAAIHYLRLPYINMGGEYTSRQAGGGKIKQRPVQSSTSSKVTSAKGGGKLKSATDSSVKKRRRTPGTRALMEIRKLQKTGIRLMRFAPTQRAVRSAIQENGHTMHIQPQATQAVMYFVETHMIKSWEVCQKLAIHGKRQTILPKDCLLYNDMGLWKGMDLE